MIVHLGAVRAADDNSLWTPEEMLRATADEDVGEHDAGIVILHTRGDSYEFGYRLSNLRYSEAVALLEAVKFQMLAVMTGND